VVRRLGAALTETLERVQPRLVVCGHIHEAYGAYCLGDTEILNVSLVDDHYRRANSVVEIVV
jgi:Icc-related predicted phosphoesterase